ncbi:hypothetical protein [Serratia liquefaciens]|uniref:hypothetical protein n=1 Tax=Serratia liquefaciens TaxID=614 RepID=UPI00102253A1|nr:hypothetical protein [Serratia liquefaciens]
MNSWNRSKTQYIAGCINSLENQDGTKYSSDALVDIWNAKYNLVPNDQLPALKNQVELELAAIRGASENHLTINNLAAAKFGLDSVLGSHVPSFEPEPIK